MAPAQRLLAGKEGTRLYLVEGTVYDFIVRTPSEELVNEVVQITEYTSCEVLSLLLYMKSGWSTWMVNRMHLRPSARQGYGAGSLWDFSFSFLEAT